MKMFIFGAGFTKSVFQNSPLNNELISALGKKFSSGEIISLKHRYSTNDIEIALTRLDVEVSELNSTNGEKRDELVQLRHAIEHQLAQFFSEYCASEDLLVKHSWLNNFTNELFSTSDIALSLNYDCLLEGLLDCADMWTPTEGYGSPFNNVWASNNKPEKSPVTVLKIHGSANFVIAPYFDKPTCKSVNFVFDELYFPRSAKNTHFDYGAGLGKKYLIAPSYVKLPTVEMNYLMIDALSASTKADRLIIIGTSLRPEDTFLTLLITNFLRQPGWRERRIIIVDPFADKIREQLLKYWGVNVCDQIVSIPQKLENSVSRLLDVCGTDKVWAKEDG